MCASIWHLQDQFLISDMNRLDHPRYFHTDFSCTDIENFFSAKLKNNKDIWQERKSLNKFFDRLFAPQPTPQEKGTENRFLYVKMKWMVFLHQLIQSSYEGKPILYTLTFKGLQVYTDFLKKSQKQLGPFELYTINTIFKPYLQYLSKLCLLNQTENTPQKITKSLIKAKLPIRQLHDDKENHFRGNEMNSREMENTLMPIKTPKPSSMTLQTLCTQSRSNSASRQGSPQSSLPEEQICKWYRCFNLVSQTLESLHRPLTEMKTYFSKQFPYLNNISKLILIDLQKSYKKLTKQYKQLSDYLQVTPLELEHLQMKILKFCQDNINFLDLNTEMVESDFHGLEADQVRCFMNTPMKSESEIKFESSLIKPKKLEMVTSAFYLQ